MAPHNYTGRSAQAPIKSLPGAVISIAETPPGNAPALHAHDTAIENFFVINGRYKIMWGDEGQRSEEHTSELQSLMRISYAVFCLKKNTKQNGKVAQSQPTPTPAATLVPETNTHT